MHEKTYEDGKVEKEFLKTDGKEEPAKEIEKLQKELMRLHARDIANPKVKEIRQKKIGRNEECPCGSGKKFKKCCIEKARTVDGEKKAGEDSGN